MVWVIAFGELFFGDLWCVVWGYGGMRTHFSLLNPHYLSLFFTHFHGYFEPKMHHERTTQLRRKAVRFPNSRVRL